MTTPPTAEQLAEFVKELKLRESFFGCFPRDDVAVALLNDYIMRGECLSAIVRNSTDAIAVEAASKTLRGEMRVELDHVRVARKGEQQ